MVVVPNSGHVVPRGKPAIFTKAVLYLPADTGRPLTEKN